MAYLLRICPKCERSVRFEAERTLIFKGSLSALIREAGSESAGSEAAAQRLSGLSITRCPECAVDFVVLFRIRAENYLSIVREHFPAEYESGTRVSDDRLFGRLDTDMAGFVEVDSFEVEQWPPGFPQQPQVH